MHIIAAREQRHVGDLVGMGQCGGLRRHCGASHQHAPHPPDFARDQARSGQILHLRGQREIKVAVQRIDPAIAMFDNHGHFGMLRQIQRQDRRDVILCSNDAAPQPYDARRLFLQFRHAFKRGARAAQHGLAPQEKPLPRIGQRHAAGGAVDQADTKRILQHRNAAAQPRLVHADRACGGREAAVLGDCGEIGKVVEVHCGVALRASGVLLNTPTSFCHSCVRGNDEALLGRLCLSLRPLLTFAP